jgi:pyrroloquinoline quinone biosynthesis protein B
MNKISFLSKYMIYCLIALFISCKPFEEPNEEVPEFFLTVLGIAQDAGYPQANCHKDCCINQWNQSPDNKMVSCLGVVDKTTNSYYIFDATPDFKHQMKRIQQVADMKNELPEGIFLTHAHIGHYTGLIHLGREAIGSSEVPVFAMPKMSNFLEENGPWSQLVRLNNIVIQPLVQDSTIILNNKLSVTPILVPHRDEYSETVGYSIRSPQKSILFIPDIDKWQKWERDIIGEINKHDVSYLDGSFFANGEIPNRDMSEIPHPFVMESMELFQALSLEKKASVRFIHFNHTNPLLKEKSEAYKEVIRRGFSIAREGEIISMD